MKDRLAVFWRKHIMVAQIVERMPCSTLKTHLHMVAKSVSELTQTHTIVCFARLGKSMYPRFQKRGIIASLDPNGFLNQRVVLPLKELYPSWQSS
jgi:hypothetical protein